MADAIITRVFQHADGGIRVEVESARHEGFGFIYRDASSVRWDEESACLYVLVSAGLPPESHFRQIKAAVQQEYGTILKLDASTLFDGLPAELVKKIKTAT